MQVNLNAIRTIVAPALLATCLAGTAFAEPNIAISGAVDIAAQHGSGSINTVDQVVSGNYLASKLSLKGSHDLGSGLKGGFWLEAGINADSGSGQNTNTNNQTTGSTGGGGLTFNRRSHASLGGNWGEFRIGRDFTPLYMNMADFEPMDVGGSGATQILSSSIVGTTLVRASNSVSYLYGHDFNAAAIGYGPRGFKGSGFQLHAMYYLGENPSDSATSQDGKGYGIRANYSTGKFTVSGAFGQTSYQAGNVQQNSVGLGYDFGWATVMGLYEADKKGAVSANGWQAGALVPVGKGTVRFSYSQYGTDATSSPTAKKLSVGYLYSLDERTTLYMAAAQLRNEGTSAVGVNGAQTAPGSDSNGVDFGISYRF